ncbi:MAG: LCP family protein [Ornithinimicrobium sp.]
MPHRPEDDWTRPMPRTSRNRGEPGPSWEDDWTTDRQRRDQERHGTAGAGGGQGRAWEDNGRDGYVDDGWRDDRGAGEGGRRPPDQRSRYGSRRRRPHYGLRRVTVLVILLVGAYVAAMIWAVAASWLAIEEVDATPTTDARPASASGSNVVLVGTDSRSQLTREQRNELKTGSTEGSRADTIMLLHLPSGGEPTLLSLPRDSYVEIPGRGMNKLNASYAIGGPPLLVDTVEQSTDLPVDGYLEIGFDGFVEVVQAVGGVEMCLPDAVTDEKSDLDLPAGCQELEGKDALAYVRMRYADPRGDLGRVERQREFLSALVKKMTSPSTLFVPWRLHDAGTSTGASLRRGDDTSLWEMGKVALAMRSISGGSGQSITVPIADTNYVTAAGSTVLWDEAEAEQLFEALRTDEPLTVEP